MFAFRRPERPAARLASVPSVSWFWRGSVFLAIFWIAAGRSWAQEADDGAVHGWVRDAANQPVEAATVRLDEREGEPGTEVQVERDGSFLVPGLRPGVYRFTLQAPGHLHGRAEGVTVALGQTTELQVVLDRVGPGLWLTIGKASEGGGSEAKNAFSLPGSPSGTAARADAVALPDQDADGLVSLHGLASTQNSTVVDGVGTTQAYTSVQQGRGSDPAPDPDGDADSAELGNGPANGLSRGRHAGAGATYSQGAVKDFRVTGDSYTAQMGHSAGGVITSVTRSGTEAFHGSVSAVVGSQLFAAANPLSVATSYTNGAIASAVMKPHDLREVFAGALGGPVLRSESLVFFDAAEFSRRGFPAICSPADPAFYTLTAIQKSLLASRGVRVAQINTALNYLSSLTGSTPRRADQNNNFARLDWHPPAHPNLVAELGLQYNLVRWSGPAALLEAPVVNRARASLGSSSGALDAFLLRFDSKIRPRLVNRLRVAYTRDLQYETPQTPLTAEPAISPGGLAPEVNIGPNGLIFGTPASLSHLAFPDERRLEATDSLTWTHGHHSVAVGGTISYVQEHVATQTNVAGTFRYDSGLTKGYAGGLVDFITDSTYNVNVIPNGGCPSITATTHDFCFRSFSQSFGESSASFSTQDWSGFVQETWHPGRRLLLHAGVRYEYTLLPLPQNPNPALDALFGTRGATSIFPEDRNNFGPRVALAWQPFGAGRGSVHVGYGLFYGRLPGATIRAALTDTAQKSSTTSIRITPTAVVACPQVASQGFGYPCAFSAPPTGVVAATTSAVVLDRRFRLPVVQQGSLTLERPIGRESSVSASYIFNLDRQLPSSTDLNIAPSTQTAHFQLQGGTGAPGVTDGETFSLPMYTSRVSTSFGPVTDVESNVDATYNGLAVGAFTRLSHSFQVQGRYTWSKAIDFGQAQSAIPRTNGQLDPFTNGYDKGLSSLDYPWAAHLMAEWSPVLAFGPRWLRGTANGFLFMPIASLRAGRPYTFDLSGGARLAGGHESLNGSGGALYLPTVGRNTLRLPPTENVDLRAGRGFRAGDHVRLDMFAEAYNLLNHTNISSVTQRAFLVGTAVNGVTPLVFQNAAEISAEGLNTQPFGTPIASSTSSARERRIQLGGRVEF